MNEVWIQIIVAIGGIVVSGLALIRYWIRETNKVREKELEDRKREREEIFKLFKDMQTQMIESFQKFQLQYLETYNQKNGQIERISNSFVKTIDALRDQLTRALNKINSTVENNTNVIANNTRATERASTIAEHLNEEK